MARGGRDLGFVFGVVTLEKNFDWIVSKNPFDESNEPKIVHRGSSKTHLDKIQFIVEKGQCYSTVTRDHG
jgi:hypothetical protein